MTKLQEIMDSYIEQIKEEIDELTIELDGLGFHDNHAERMIWINERLEHLDHLLELLTDR